MKGNAGGPGNPFARKVAALRSALVNFVTEDDMKHIAFVLKMKAESGHIQAMKLLFQYVIGKPTASVGPDRLDVDEWEKVQETARLPEEAAEVMDRLPAEMACRLTQAAWPGAVERNLGGALADEVRDMGEGEEEQEASAKPQAVGKQPSTKGGNGPNRPSRYGSNGEELTRLAQLVSRTLAGRCDDHPDDDEGPSPKGGNGLGRRGRRPPPSAGG